MKKKKYQNNYPMIEWAKDLFPLNRSLTGEGTSKTLKYFKKIHNDFKILKFKSGTKVFDWIIPDVWNIENSYIYHLKTKKKFAEFKKNNLHIVGYSYPVNKTLDKKELLKYIYTQKNQPDSIPYVTSYYKKRWGLCMSENEKKKLPSGKYKVFIDSNLKKGHMEMAHLTLKGQSKKEIFFSSYVCHPSMANNELSGPVVLNALVKYIKLKFPKRKYTYKFVLLPETIGSIAYLSRFKNQLKKNVICGFNITCVGDERGFSYVKTPDENSLADQAISASLFGKKNLKAYSFLYRGSDERQYCSPGIDLPVCCFSKSKYYKEYHTSRDNFDVVTQKGLEDSLKVMTDIVDAFEIGLYPRCTTLCEPNLGKRNLYPTISHKDAYSEKVFLRKNFIAYSNGKRNIFEIANILKSNIKDLINEYKILKNKRLLI
jgi:aminopeptidase-like protein